MLTFDTEHKCTFDCSCIVDYKTHNRTFIVVKTVNSFLYDTTVRLVISIDSRMQK